MKNIKANNLLGKNIQKKNKEIIRKYSRSWYHSGNNKEKGKAYYEKKIWLIYPK